MKKRVISFILALAMVCSLLPGTAIGAAAAETDYTFDTYATTLATDWNPHTWTSSADSTVLDLLTTPLVDMTVADSENGIYQWVYLAAQSVTDVTSQHQDDLVKYGASATDATSGYVFEIALNPDMKWQDGTVINADTYIYSMERLLNPDLHNYRANNYYSGEAAIAGAEGYFYSGRDMAIDNGLTAAYTMSDLVLGEDGIYTTPEGGRVYIPTTEALDWFHGYSLNDYIEAYGSDYFDVEAYASLVALADEDGNVTLTEESAALLLAVISNPNWAEGEGYEPKYLKYIVTYPEVTFDTVGLYKVDDYTIRYVTQSYIDINYLLTSLTSNWLVYESLYETGSYGNAVSNTMSYGPYKLSSITETQMVLTQNENHYEYTVNSDGSLSSVTEFLVDGKQVNQWQTQNYVIHVMDSDTAKAAFLAGQLDEWNPSSDDLVAYSASDRLYKVDESYTMSLFFNSNLEALQAMDNAEEYDNANSVVLSNDSFREAFSLAIDRSDWVTATSGYKPAVGLMNNLYFYDIYNNPNSSYRYSEQAMAAICDLYGVSYTADTLKEAYDSITGHDLAQAKALMAQACDELVEAGLYAEGEEIFINVGWTSRDLTAVHRAQVAKLTAYLNAAAEGSGFGTITLNPVDNTNCYSAVPEGQLAIGYGGWGGASFYPFQVLRIYLDPDYVMLNEGACWDPATEELTLTVGGEEVTMTWQNWSKACTRGNYRNADFDTKLTITAALEAGFLGKYYRIPLAGSTSCSMLSHQLDYYTQNYNVMYGFGGLRLVTYNYSDAEWEAYVASGELDYGGTELPTEPEETEPIETTVPPPEVPEETFPPEPTEPEDIPELTGDYTYNTYTGAPATDWNPHTWTSSADSSVLDLLTTPLVEMVVEDSENGVYQWAYLAAESVTDVTADHQDDLVKYGADSTDATSGYVFDIALNPDMKWQDGTPINADTYIYSMERLLNPDRQNYRANTYYSGQAAIAGAYNYFYSNTEGYYVPYTKLYGSLADAVAATEVYIDVWNFWGAEGYIDAEGNECAQYISIADETEYSSDGAGYDAFSGAALYRDYGSYFEPGTGYDSYVVVYQKNENMGIAYDAVGLYKVDDYTIRYVTQNAIDINYLLTSLTSNWLVYESLYETGSYGNAVSNTMSYGPYKLSSVTETQMVLTQNENHYEYTVNSDGSLSSVTEFLVDGKQVNQWQTQNYVIHVMDSDTAKAAFLAGQLDEWTPSSDDLVAYSASDRLYKVDETYTMSLFFNSNLEALQAMDNAEVYDNTNSVVLSNDAFREAFSLAIDRSDWVTATSGYKPAVGLMNNLYFYDIYNNPNSSYRNSKQAMAAFCDLYGVSYTDETLKEAYASITGYNLTQAKALMAQACDELVEAGLYTEGDSITIHIAYTIGTLTAAHEAQIAKLNAYINAAAEGSGFGTITLVGDSGFNTYNAVADGTHAIGYGAWGGAAFYPFQMMQVYCAPDLYFLHEGNCWDPASEMLTLTINGEDVTMTWQDWSFSCTDGAYKDADFDTKLTITAALEAGFLGKYYRIPLASSTSCTMLSHQLDYYTQDYNSMYGFGGLRLVNYNYTDSEWEAYVASGDLSYGGSGDSGDSGEGGEEEAVETAFVAHSLSLNGDIGVNFYATLSDEFLADENAHVDFTVNGVLSGVSLADAMISTAEDGTVRYRFSYAVPAKGMADAITAQLCVSEGLVGESKTYSVAQYYTDICEQYDRTEKPELFAMIEAMLNYGAAAQEYFGYNTDNLANAEVSTAIPETVDASAYAAVVSNNDENLSYAGMSLVLESNTVLRVFFRSVSGADISGYTFTVNGQTVTPVQRGNLWYIELANIAAKELDTAYTFTAGDVTVECSALSYVCSVLNKADALDEKLVALCKALYAYNEAANTYFTE